MPPKVLVIRPKIHIRPAGSRDNMDLLIDRQLLMALESLTNRELGRLVRTAMTSIMNGTASTFDPYLPHLDIWLKKGQFGWMFVVTPLCRCNLVSDLP